MVLLVMVQVQENPCLRMKDGEEIGMGRFRGLHDHKIIVSEDVQINLIITSLQE